MSVLRDLLPSLIQTFAILFIGYAFARYKLISADGVRAMGMFVTMLSLPALLLRNMASLNFYTIQWDFFVSILIGKSLIFFGVAAVCLLRYGWTRKGLSDAGCFGIFTTQSNDFAIGIPILAGLYHHSHPEFERLIFVILPVTIMILNPIGMLLMEYGRETPDEIREREEKAKEEARLKEEMKKQEEMEMLLAGVDSGDESAVSTGIQSTATIAIPMPSSSGGRSITAPLQKAMPILGVSPSLHPRSVLSSSVKAVKPSSREDHHTASSSSITIPSSIHAFSPFSSPLPLRRGRSAEATNGDDDPHHPKQYTGDSDEDDDDDDDERDEAFTRPSSQQNTHHQVVMSTSYDGAGMVLSRRQSITPAGMRNDHSNGSRTPIPSTGPVLRTRSGSPGLDMMQVASPQTSGSSPAAAISSSSSSTAPSSTTAATSSTPLITTPSAQPPMHRILLSIGHRVITTPLVLSSIFGVILNFIVKSNVPPELDDLLGAIGDSFTALALFVLGYNMNGKLSLFSDRRQLLVPLLLITAKCVILPIIVRLALSILGSDPSSPLSQCTFLVASFPPAPSSHFFALQFGARSVELIGPTMVLGTLLGAPILFVSAQATMVDVTISAANTILTDTAQISAGFGFIGGAYLITRFLYNKMWFSVRQRLLLLISVYQLVITFTIQFCDNPPAAGTLSGNLMFITMQGMRYGIYMTAAYLGANELIRKGGVEWEEKMFRVYVLTSIPFVILANVLLMTFSSSTQTELPFDSCSIRYGDAQLIVTCVVLGVSAVIMTVGLVKIRDVDHIGAVAMEKDETVTTTTSFGKKNNADNNSLSQSLLHSHDDPPSSSSSHSLSDSPIMIAVDGEDNQQKQKSAAASSHVPSSSITAASSSSSHPSSLLSSHHPRDLAIENSWLFALRISLVLQLTDIFIYLVGLAWHDTENGIHLELRLISFVLCLTMPLYYLALFAYAKGIMSPLMPLLKCLTKAVKRMYAPIIEEDEEGEKRE